MNYVLLINKIFLLPLFVLGFAFARLKLYMLFFQQEEYDGYRLLKRMVKDPKIVDKKLTLLLLCYAASCFFISKIPSDYFISFINLNSLLLIIWFAGLYFTFYFCAKFSFHYLKGAKKKLVMTPRAKRIFTIAYVLLFVYIGLNIFLNYKINDPNMLLISIIGMILFVHIIPFSLIVGNLVLWPIESLIKLRYYLEAYNKVRKLKPFVIGITGSYGKTSTKYILNHILSCATGDCLMTPKSVNNIMSVARIIREQLEEKHKYFIVEMGAYRKGSIRKKCKFTPPKLSIITSVGDAHYERFKSLDNVAKAKFEIAEETIKNWGEVVINADQISEKHIREYVKDKSKFTAVFSEHNVSVDEKYEIKNIEESEEGLKFIINRENKNEDYEIELPLFGQHQVYNAALAFVSALKLGIPPQTIITSLRTVPQIEHRLEVKRGENNITIIDDAYNSNPVGFTKALMLLKNLGEKSDRIKILVTPGMVELGNLHDEIHFSMGEMSANAADIILLINVERVESFLNGFYSSPAKNKRMVPVKNLEDAQKWIRENIKKDAVILYENDLPDLYEHNVNL